MTETRQLPMTTAEALEITKGTRIRVRMIGRRRSRLAVTTGRVSERGRWALVPFAYVKNGHDRIGQETLSRHDHYAQVPLDQVELDR